MKIIGLLSWYDEPEQRLRDCVASIGTIVDHLIALDGAYVDFPHDTAVSPTSQAEAIMHAAERAGIGCEVVVPPKAWQGNEIEKRTHLFHLAEKQAIPYEDWYMIIDADTHVIEAHDARQHLETNPYDCAASLLSSNAEDTRWKNFFRAIPGLHVRSHHAGYVTPEGRVLWNGHHGASEQGLNLYVRIRHRPDQGARNLQKQEYERGRNEQHLPIAAPRQAVFFKR